MLIHLRETRGQNPAEFLTKFSVSQPASYNAQCTISFLTSRPDAIDKPEIDLAPKQGSPEQVTQLLTAWSDGDRSALEKLLPLVEAELHRLAHRYMSRERGDHTLQTTALVNEAYLKLVDQRVTWRNRAHFFAIAAQIMRRILIDHARKHLGPQRGGGRVVSLEDVPVINDDRASELVALDEALVELARLDSRKASVVELRYFGGLDVNEIALVLKVSPDTVTREWRRAKAFLRRELSRV